MIAMKQVSFTEAKARLSSVVDDARNGQATVITRHGREEAVVVPFSQWQSLTGGASLWDYLTNAPIDGRELTRSPSKMRDFEF